MQQEFHRFKAESLDAAYQLMRERLGEDAVVLRASQVREGGFMGFMAKKLIEVTASAPAPAPLARPKSAVERAYGVTSKPVAAVRPNPTKASIGSDQAVAESVEYFKQLVTDTQKRLGIRTESSSAVEELNGKPVASPVIPFVRPKDEPGPTDALRSELKELRGLVEILVAETPGAGVPVECAPMYKLLLDAGVSRKAAAGLVAAAVHESDLQVIREPQVLRQRLAMEIRKRSLTTGGVSIGAGACRRIALVGSTGVGKTTNLAKLAAHFAVRQRSKVALVTADTYRVAAVDQLRVYANIIGLPIHIANNPKEMAETVGKLRDHDVVLIDTAGGSQFNKGQLRELRDMLMAAEPTDVKLVLGANTQLDDLRQIALNFTPLKPTALLFSKLDETRRYGGLYTLMVETGLPLSYFSLGQNVPDDLVLAQPELVADLLLDGRIRPGSSVNGR